MSSRKRRQPFGIYDIARLPVTPVKSTPGYETFKDMKAREQREAAEAEARTKTEQEAERMKPFRALENEIKIAAAEHAEKVRRFYSKPLHVIAAAGADVAPVDMIGDYPERSGRRDTQKEFEVYKTFRDDLASRNCHLSQDGWNRLGSYISVLADGRGIEVTPAVWEQSVERLHSLGCFGDEIAGYQRPRPQTVTEPAAQPVKQQPDFTNVSTDHKDWRAAVDAHWGREVKEFFDLWADSMYRNWGVSITPELAQKAGDFFVKTNRNPLRHKSYDNFRLEANLRRWLPDGKDYRTESEKLADLIENSDLNDRSVRLAINRKQAEISGRI